MTEIAFTQILILVLQCLIVGSLLLLLFRLRSYLGLSLLFTALGVFQYMQVFLVSSIYIEVVPGIMVSPGSMIMFTSSLFAILLVYVREDALQTRKVVYALLAANIVLASLHFIFNWAIDGKFVKLLFKIPEGFFAINARILLVGTFLLILDAFLIIYLYDIISRFIKPLFFRILIVMTIVLSLDTVLFSIGAFAGTGQVQTSLISGIIGKLSSSVIYSAIFSIYLIYIDNEFVNRGPSRRPFKDVFTLLDYRRKFDEIHTEHELKKEELLKKEIEYRKLFESMAQGVTYQNSKGEIIAANPAALKILGLTMDQITGKTSMDPHWRSVREDGTDFPGDEHPSMIALRSGKEVNNAVMGVFNPTNQDYRWININSIPQFLEDASESYQVFTTFEDITVLKNAENKLIQQRDELSTLLSFSEALNKTFDIQEIMQTATDNISKLLGENSSAIYLVEGSRLYLSATTPKLSPEMPDSLRFLNQKEHLHIKKAIDENAIVIIEDTDHEELTPQEQEIVEIRELKSIIYLPVEVNEKIMSVLIWGSKSKTEFDKPLIDLCNTLVNHLAISIQNSNLIYDLEKELTERKKAEKQLKASEERFRIIVENAPDPVFIQTNNCFAYVNKHAIDLFGVNHENELIGKKVLDHFHPDFHRQALERIRSLNVDKKLVHEPFEQILIQLNGNEKWVETKGAPIKYNGENGELVFIRDITDRKETQIKIKESEEKFSKIFENSPVAIILTKLSDGEVIEANKAIFEITGYKPEEFLGNKTPQMNIWKHEKDRDYYVNTLLTKGRVIGYETEFVLKSGEIRICRVYGELIKLNNEDFIMGIIQDINDSKLQEIEIKEYQESLKQLTTELTLIEERQKKEIAENIHDHLSQSLVISKMKLHELEGKAELKKYLDEINFLQFHISEALDNSRKISNELSPPILYQLGIIDTMYWLVHKIKKQYNIQVDFSTNVDGIELSNTELVFVYRSIQELITNTVKHAKATLIRIGFKLSSSVLEIEISDNGKGFDTSNLKHKYFKSSGFGLFAVKERIQNLKGTFSIESSLKKGTKIFISIPLDNKN